MAETFTRAFWLFYAVTFIVQIPASIYEVLKEGLPKIILVILYSRVCFSLSGFLPYFPKPKDGVDGALNSAFYFGRVKKKRAPNWALFASFFVCRF
jgi:hypothetical protein